MIRVLARRRGRVAFIRRVVQNEAAMTRLIRSYATSPDVTPYRQQLKQQVKLRNQNKRHQIPLEKGSAWELTVGIEIHAALDTERKLFSSARTSINESPNSRVELFDLAYPGSQPVFQLPTLIPALRAAIALDCEIQKRSTFDRKHYFYADQPAGYQITQFYEPFAKNGSITLYRHDGIAPEDGDSVTIGIKQIQLEQDTAKSIVQSATKTLLDFNRVSHPLIEIISLPQIHYAATAAAYVRKIQRILRSVGAVTAGMEIGGLRADVNVSVRRFGDAEPGSSYAGTGGLGQRTEIKNLGSIKAVEDAVNAEKQRQVEILVNGGAVEGETRGWSIGGTETHKLRKKEGEVDYRYMPDPDIGPLVISDELVQHLKTTLPKSQDQVLAELTSSRFGLTPKDALTLITLDNGQRLEYYYDTLCQLEAFLGSQATTKEAGRVVGNWTLHEIGALFTKNGKDWTVGAIPSTSLAQILNLLVSGEITTDSAKIILQRVFSGDESDPTEIANAQGLIVSEISDQEYHRVLDIMLESNPDMVTAIQTKGQKGKIMWFVGQAMKEFKRAGNAGAVRPEKLKELLTQKFDLQDT